MAQSRSGKKSTSGSGSKKRTSSSSRSGSSRSSAGRSSSSRSASSARSRQASSRAQRRADDGHEEQQTEQHAPEQTPHRGGSHLGAGRHHVVLAVGAPRHDCDGLQADDEVLVEIEDLLVGGLRFRFARVTEHDERTHMMELLSMRSNTAPL